MLSLTKKRVMWVSSFWPMRRTRQKARKYEEEVFLSSWICANKTYLVVLHCC